MACHFYIMTLFIYYVIIIDQTIMKCGGGTVQQHNVCTKFRDNQSNHSKIEKGADTNTPCPLLSALGKDMRKI